MSTKSDIVVILFCCINVFNMIAVRGGALNFGLRAMCHQKDPTFFPRFHRKTPIFTNFHPMTPYFSKISTFLTKCWEIFGHFGPESPYFLMHFTERPPIFVHFVTERPPFLPNLSPKDPYIWGAWWHSYVTFICECLPRELFLHLMHPTKLKWIESKDSPIIIFNSK